ncbi:MAG: exodeoxyribonuclease V subunit gamma [Comamonadaceae bacterium]|nr:exodeoxyribonuclease V subunit gamma [Comamonadaceae bacterium]
MLTIRFSNRLETLAALLVAQLAAPRGVVFVADELIVPSAALRRAADADAGRPSRRLRQRRASRTSAQWLWRQIGARGARRRPSSRPSTPPVLAWRV